VGEHHRGEAARCRSANATLELAMDLPDLQRVRELLPDYDRPGPRYTSYPTAPIWTESFGESEFRDALARRPDQQLAIYVHIPFCESLCTYCACNREISRDHSVAVEYLDALAIEAARLREALGAEAPCAQLAIGGGTPTYLDPEQLARLAEIVDANFPRAEGAERSIEVDPRTTSPAQLEMLAEHGFNRISLGVQDLSPVVQKAIHRIQSIEQTSAVTRKARELGFESVNYDLIYGLPFQTVDSFGETLRSVLEERPDRIALYSYAHVTWVSKQQRGFERKDLPDASRKLAIFSSAMERLCDAGYGYLGLDHFALPEDELFRADQRGELRRNFMGYTTRTELDVLALGASGISELGDVYAQSLRSSSEWSEALSGEGLATLRGWTLSVDDQRRRWLIRRLMCQCDINPNAYAELFGEELADRIPGLEGHLERFVADGLLEASDEGWTLTPEGRIFMRPVAMTFDSFLEPAADGAPRFSRTV
jgi:oxygen-independent coproporphyrinogen-3 oxidase